MAPGKPIMVKKWMIVEHLNQSCKINNTMHEWAMSVIFTKSK